MARSISVKVPTASVIEMIEDRIKEINDSIASYPKDLADYKKAKEAYRSAVLDYVAKYVKKNISDIRFDSYEEKSPLVLSEGYGGVMGIKFDTKAIAGFPPEPVEPVVPNRREWIGRDHTSRLELLEKNLKVLKMTTQEEISATTYGALMEIL